MRDAPEVLVIGAGVFGLWCARACAQAGLRVRLVSREGPEGGASAGLIGALTPHMPDRWRALHAYQFAGLTSLSAEAAALAEETGIDPGHARVGRLTPHADQRARRRAEQNAAAAAERWQGRAVFEVLDAPPGEAAGYLDPAACPAGVIHDTLSGRIDPRAYLAALAATLASTAPVETGWTLHRLAPGRAVFDRGTIAAGHIVLAAGWESFALAGLAGDGMKGQAAMLGAVAPPRLPVIHADGLFLVARGARGVAVGSTSEHDWAHGAPDRALEAVLARARALAPALVGAPVLERWAGIRPRAASREPVIGPIRRGSRLILATGGYKIGFAIAHLVGRAVAASIAGTTPVGPLPPDFAPASADAAR